MIVRGRENYAAIRQWFDELWGKSEDFGKQVIDVIRSSWASDRYAPMTST